MRKTEDKITMDSAKITSFEDFDVAVGFNNLEQIKLYQY